jgi:release factor glutamine methyltransferase
MASVNIASLVARVREVLVEAGVPSPEVDAEILVGLALGLTRSQVHLNAGDEVSGAQEERALELARKRCCRIPLQHLAGEVEFWSRRFKVRPGVFIPRPETETLVRAVAGMVMGEEGGAGAGRVPGVETTSREVPLRILDLCTGTGVVGVTLASLSQRTHVIATDISFEAVELARENAIMNGVASRMDFIVGDGLSFLEAAGGWDPRFDVIVFNPPYVESGAIDQLEPEVRDHDPRAALDGGPDGLRFIEGILPGAASSLKEGGLLAFEIGETQGEGARQLVKAAALEFKEVVKDLAGKDRIVIGRKPSG